MYYYYSIEIQVELIHKSHRILKGRLIVATICAFTLNEKEPRYINDID